MWPALVVCRPVWPQPSWLACVALVAFVALFGHVVARTFRPVWPRPSWLTSVALSGLSPCDFAGLCGPGLRGPPSRFVGLCGLNPSWLACVALIAFVALFGRASASTFCSRVASAFVAYLCGSKPPWLCLVGL